MPAEGRIPPAPKTAGFSSAFKPKEKVIPQKIPGDTVVIVPACDGALALGVAPADDGKLRPILTVRTEDLGNFCVVLSATDLALVAAVGKTLLNLNAEQVKELHERLNNPEGETHE